MTGLVGLRKSFNHLEILKDLLYYFLDFDDELNEQDGNDYDGTDPTQDSRYLLVTSGKVRKLSACNDRFSALKKRNTNFVDNGGDHD